MASTNPGGREIPIARGDRADAPADAPFSRRPRNVYLLPRPQEEGVEGMAHESGTQPARGEHYDPTTEGNQSLASSSSVASFSSRTARKRANKREEAEEAPPPPRGRPLPSGLASSSPLSDSFSPLLEHRKVVTHSRVGAGGRLSRRPSVGAGRSSLAMGGGEREAEADLHPPPPPSPSALPSRTPHPDGHSLPNDHSDDGNGEKESAIARRRRRAPLPAESISSTASKETSLLSGAVPPPPPISTVSQRVRTAPQTSNQSSPLTTRTSATSSFTSGSGEESFSSVAVGGEGTAAHAELEGGQAPAPIPGGTKGIEVAGTAAAPPPRQTPLDREMFQSLNFRADHFANGLLQRYLNHYIAHAPREDVRDGTSRSRRPPPPPPPPPSRDRRPSLGASPPPPPSPAPPTGEGASENDQGAVSSSVVAAGQEVSEKAAKEAKGGSTPTTPLGPSSTDPQLYYYATVAHALGEVLRSTLQEVDGFARQEAHARRGKELQAKRVEWEERRLLAHVRTTGLHDTMLQLQQYERYIHNAQAATAGIVQHLTQTNARVQRGKAIGVLLKHFRMFLSIPTATLRQVLSQLSPLREWQRRGVTAWWEAFQAQENHATRGTASVPWQTTVGDGGGEVADRIRRSFHFYDIDTGVEEAMLRALREEGRHTTGEGGSGRPPPPHDHGGGGGGGGAGPVDGEEEGKGRRRKKVVVVKTKKIRPLGAVHGGEPPPPPPSSSSSSAAPAEDARGPTTEKKKRKIIRHGQGAAGAPVPTVAAIRAAEAAAAQAGLDPQFISRRATEMQTEWCQRLRLLSAELADEVAHAENIAHFTRWLQEELALDVFHLMARYRVNAEQYPASVLPSLPLGKALLAALELVSRLYVELAASVEELFVLCISHVVENLRGTLYTEYVPPAYSVDSSEGGGASGAVTPGSATAVPLAAVFPPPGVPTSPVQSAKKPKEMPTPTSTGPPSPSLAMEHFSRYTASAFPRILGFLTERVRREGFIVEALSGSAVHDHHSSLAFQQLLSHVVEKIVHPLLTQQIQLAESYKDEMLRREAPLSPRSRRRHVPRVLDAMVYRSTMLLHAILFYQDLQREFEKDVASPQDACFLHPLGEAIFRAPRARYVEQKEEWTLLQRTYTYVEESYTRALHAMPDELLDVRPAHTAKLQAMLDALVDSTARVRMILRDEKEVLPMTVELVACGIRQVGQFFTGELQKAIDSVRGEKERWRVKPKSEQDLLRPTKPEAQQCGFRMLWFIQNALGMVHESLNLICAPLTQRFPRLKIDLERIRAEAFANLDALGETLFHVSVNAMICSALSILMHYQQKNDFLVTEKSKSIFGAGNADGGGPSSSSSGSSPTSRTARGDHAPLLSVVPPCTRACTLFCQYITRQFTEAREMIEQSEGMAAAEGSGGGAGGGGTGGSGGGGGGEASDGDVLDANGIDQDLDGVVYGRYGEGTGGGGAGRWMSSSAKPAAELYLAKARSMSMAELLYGDGDPSGYTFVRVVGVCLFRGIGAHLKSFVVNDLGALVYKQDVTAYAEVMRPLSTTPTLSGAVVKVLFRMLRETSGLMLMPLDHIKEVKDSGMLQVMHPAEKLAFLKIREDVRIAFRMIHK